MWIQSQQQQDEFMHSPHYTGSPHFDYLGCATCHNPHNGVAYEQGGIKDNPNCQTCHPNHLILGKESLTCIDCHMPYSVKSAVTESDHQADMRSHLFKIWVTDQPRDSMFYTEGENIYAKLDEDNMAYGNTLDVVCLRCHSGWSIEHVYETARNIHTEGLFADLAVENAAPSNFTMSQNYPNPFNPVTTIGFTLVAEAEIELAVFDLSGRKIQTIFTGQTSPGEYSAEFDANNLPAGIYFYRLKMDSDSMTKKMLLLK